MRTSLYIPTALQQRLKAVAKNQQLSVSKLVAKLLDKALVSEESQQLDALYQAMGKAKGTGNPALTDVSTNINRILYSNPSSR